MDYNIGKVIKKLVIAFIITIFLFGVVIALGDFKGMLAVLLTANWNYLFFALLLLVVFMILNIDVFYLLLKSKNKNVKLRDVFLIGATEPFFNGITPFSTGGQPFQAYALYKRGIPIEDSTTALMMNFIIYMVPTNLFALISLFFFQRFVSQIPQFLSVAILGFVINFITVMLFIGVCFSKKVRHLIIKFVVWLGNKKAFKKLFKGKSEKINKSFKDIQNGCNGLLKKPKTFAACIILKVISLIAYYSIPFLFIKALHVDIPISEIFYIMLGTSFAITMVVWVPTPGGAGGIELAFKTIFATVSGVTPIIASGGMVLWRIYTYYLLMIVGFVCYLVFEYEISKDEKRISHLKSRTT